VYIGAVVALTGVLFAFLAAHPTPDPWDLFGAMVLFAAMVVSERLSVRLSPDATLSIAAIPHLVAVLLLPPWLSMALAGGAMLADQLSARAGLRKLLFNVASIALTIGVTALAADAVGLTRAQLVSARWQQVPLFLLVAAAYQVTSNLLLSSAVSLTTAQPLGRVFLNNARFALPAEAAVCGIGGLVAVLWVVTPGWAPLLLFPGLISQIALKYVSSSKHSNARLALMAEASRLLALSFDREEELPACVARLVVPTAADLCVVYLQREDGAMARAAAAQADPVRPRLDHDSEVSAILAEWVTQLVGDGRRRPALIPDLRDQRRGADRLAPRHQRRLARLGLKSLIGVPLVAREHALGVLVFATSTSDRRYGADDLALAEELARRCAVSIENARLHAQAQQATRLRDEFLSVAAHELKTPMTSLRGYAQLLAQGLNENKPIDPKLLAKGLRVIDTQAEKLSQLTAQLLDVSRIEAGKLQLQPREIDLAGLVRALANATQASAQHHVMRLDLPDHCRVVVDPLRIEQVVTNLFSNAIKYSPDGGTIDVSLSSGADGVRLGVRDHGIGIPPERRARLFDRFYQAHGEGHFGGLGLGLFISRQIVELHGGTLEADFPVDGGTRFSVTLPASPAQPQFAAA
jgi:signal transduction histidine kinase